MWEKSSSRHPDSKKDRPPRYGWLPGREGYRPLNHLFDCALYKISLEVTCRRCGHRAVLDGPGCWWHHEKKGRDQMIWMLQKSLRCSKCWAKGKRVRNPDIRQTKERPTQFLGIGPTEAEWKRIVTRQRT